MNIEKMTRADFSKIKRRKWDEELTDVFSIVLIPTRKKHGSGYMVMDYVACKIDGSFVYCGGGDVFHLDGIGGFGYRRTDNYLSIPTTIPPAGWSIDCLPKSGYLRLWCPNGQLICGNDLSSMEIFFQKRKEKCFL